MPTTGLNVIALISGGKDSLYSILHCIRNGHNVVALANLHPAPRNAQDGSSNEQDEEEDIDSFMYQTIGHSVIPLYEKALGMPLYRAPITGGAVDTSRIYSHDSGEVKIEDETEDLVPLLQNVMRNHPEANAVSAGAILSTYQRTRIENVASRLKLAPLAWLWMYPVLPAPEKRKEDALAVGQAGLLEDMAGAGCDARIIKVASGGLDEGFLWESVSGAAEEGRRVRRRIVKGMARFAEVEDLKGAVLGEGGEYETLAVDGPSFLWKGKIEVDGFETGIGDGGVAFARLRGAKVVMKQGDVEESHTADDVRRPTLLDEPFVAALEDVRSVQLGEESTKESTAFDEFAVKPYHAQAGSTCTMANMVAPEAGPGAGEQMEAIVQKVQEALQSFSESATSRSTEDIVFATVLLRSMSDFALMNNVYISLFKKPNPPARVTVACGDTLPTDVKVMVSFVVDKGLRDKRQGLHVQSRSYWAPANIGPYSQAMSIPIRQSRLIYIAGQIPLEPASMEIATSESSWLEAYCLRAVLSLQHLWRIGEAMQVDWWLGGVAFLTGTKHVETRAQVAWHLWRRMHARPKPDDDSDNDEGPELDAWDIKYGRRTQDIIPDVIAPGLPRFTVLDEDTSNTISPFLAVEVDELPRGSDIEWQGLGSQCEHAKLKVDGDAVSATADGTYSYTCLEIGTGATQETIAELVKSAESVEEGQHLVSQVVLYTTQPVSERLWAGQVVPCRSIWGREGRPLAAGVVVNKEIAQ